MTESQTPVPPGEGERRAQRGYVPQYASAAVAIYTALERDELIWVGLADRSAGIADDLVLGLQRGVVGHQFKTSRFPKAFRLDTFLMGADGLLAPLASSWQRLRQAHPADTVEIRVITNDFPSSSDKLTDDDADHSAAFVREFELHPDQTLAQWRSSGWRRFIDKLAAASGLDDHAFEEFLRSLRIITGTAANFLQPYRLPPEAARLAAEIAALLPRLVADPRDKDRWTREELLQELGWADSFVARRTHRFPVGAYVQRNIATERALQDALQAADSGYLTLIGPPGTGKSTLLQSSLIAEPAIAIVRYLAFVPGEGQGIGRAEAEDFLNDINAQLMRSGLGPYRYRDTSLQERRDKFEALLRMAGERFQNRGVRTYIVVDGLDHIPREERPVRSLLAELPLPGAGPSGVVISLGTQRLDLADLKPAIQEQASLTRRQIPVGPLSREAVYRITDALGLNAEVSRERIFEVCRGHPLVTRYLVEALLAADTAGREALLAGDFKFENDIESVYTSAWRGINDDADASAVMAYIAHAEGPIQPEALAAAVSDQAVERALKSTRHLLTIGPQGWSVFHNSFRLFILSKPRLRYGQPDPDHSPGIYRRLAELARSAGAQSPQRWLELRYLARAERHTEALALALPARFRQQLAGGRSAADIQADIRLAFGAAKIAGNATEVFALLLARDETSRRAGAMEQAPSVMNALLAVGDIEGAFAYSKESNNGGYKLVDALLERGEIEKARALFNGIEPLGQMLGGQPNEQRQQGELLEWAERVIHFRDFDQINEAIDRLSMRKQQLLPVHEQDAELGSGLRLAAARAAMAINPESDPHTIANKLKLDDADLPYLFLQAGIRASELGNSDLARSLMSQGVAHADFSKIQIGWRRHAALAMFELGNEAVARTVFTGLEQPAIAMLDDQTGDDVSRTVTTAVIDHAELAAMLGAPAGEVAKAKRRVLQPLQVHASTVGELLGRAQAGGSIAPGEITRATRAALVYLEQAEAHGSSEYYGMYQIAAAAPVLGRALVRAARMSGESGFANVIAEFEQSFAAVGGKNRKRINLRREVAVEIYRADGDTTEACRRLEPLVSELWEDTPDEQVEQLALLASAFARVGASDRAKNLLQRLHDESLGYALAPKKDPQYSLWLEILERANAADPAGHRARVELMLRQLDGMMETAGRDSAYRIASGVLTEATMIDAATGIAAARAINARAILPWCGIVDAILLGILRRRPEMAGQCIVTWAALALPYYTEPHYRESRLGQFISDSVAATAADEVDAMVELLRTTIEAESRADARITLLERLKQAVAHRGLANTRLDDAIDRWRTEAPVRRDGGTPRHYDDVSSLAELEQRLGAEGEERHHYDAAAAFVRLEGTTNLDEANAAFDRWPAIRSDYRARFALIDRALTDGRRQLARTLAEAYPKQADEQASWNYWMGAGKLRYFQARVKLDGSSVHAEAYSDLVGDLAGGREQAQSVLLDSENIFPTIIEKPDWPEMWEHLAEQMKTTREHAIGRPFDMPDSPGTDPTLLVDLFHWALTLPIPELHRHARLGAMRLLPVRGGPETFASLCTRLMAGPGDEPVEGVRLLGADSTDSMAAVLGAAVTALVDHPDYAVAAASARLAESWGLPASMTLAELPSIYRIHLDDAGQDFEQPTLTDPESGAMRVEDRLGWTAVFSREIGVLADQGVSVDNLRYRCWMFIESWGGLAAFGPGATDRLRADLRRLEMGLVFSRPHMVVALRAIRYVAGEMRRGELLSRQDDPWLLHMLGHPAVRPAMLAPSMRPRFIRRPSTDRANWTEQEKRWLDDIDNDVRPLQIDQETVIAEVTTFICRDVRRSFALERVRGRAVDAIETGEFSSGARSFPPAVWFEAVVPMTSEPAPTIVRRFSESGLSDIPRCMLVICPYWLSRLSWRPHPDNWLIYINAAGHVVAKITWWRDGGPIDIDEDVVYGEGIIVAVTSAGRAQLESVVGHLAIQVHAHRSVKNGRDALDDRRAHSVE